MKRNGLLRLFKGVKGFQGDRPTERQWQPTNTAHDPNPPITLENGGGGAVTHATTGTLTGTGAALSGTARHNTPHPTTGTLTSSGSTIAGSANHSPAAVPHTTTGALTGPGSVVVGVSSRFRAHSTTGTLTGAGSVIVGSANRSPVAVPHTTTGALTGQGSAVSGTSSRFRAHATTGALVGDGATVSGESLRFGNHYSTGALVGGGAVVTGNAARFVTHATGGVLIGSGSVITGDAFKSSILITDFHDGDYRKKRIEKEKSKAEARRKQIQEVYELLLEEKPAVAAAIVKPFSSKETGQIISKSIDFDALMADLNRVESLWNEYVELDDEEVLTLL